eukprot:gene25346-biopygen10502
MSQEYTCGVPETAVEKLDQPPLPSAPSARPDRAPRGGGCAARGADLRVGICPGKSQNSRPPRTPRHPSSHLPATPSCARGRRQPRGRRSAGGAVPEDARRVQ